MVLLAVPRERLDVLPLSRPDLVRSARYLGTTSHFSNDESYPSYTPPPSPHPSWDLDQSMLDRGE